VKSLLAAFFAEVTLITYRAFRGGVASQLSGAANPTSPLPLPLPAFYTAPIIFYGALALFPESGSTLAASLGWGMVAATALRLWDPTTPTKAGTAAATTPAAAGTTLA
jgi:hypothetical protein